MRLRHNRTGAFTLVELLMACSIGAIILGATFTASVSMNKSLNAVDNYFATHMQQSRIIDYLSRDVKRSFSVTTSADLKTVTCVMPNYVIQAGDPEAIADSATIGTRRTPVVTGPINKSVVDYGTGTRTVLDAVTTSGSTTLTSATAAFTASDVGKSIVGTSIQSATTIQGYTSATTVVLSQAANATAAGATVTIGGTIVVYTVSGNSITRTENGTVTTIASSTDQLIPQTTDWQLSNTEYTVSTVTFQPIFTLNNDPVERSGTTVCSTSYLRNKRRGN